MGLALLWNRVKINSKKIVFPLVYAGIMIAGYMAMPANPDSISISMELVQSFRVWTAVTIGIFWGLLGIIFGSLWENCVRPGEPRLRLLIKIVNSIIRFQIRFEHYEFQ